METKNNIQDHWNKVYSKSELNKLGWYEEDPKPSLDLIEKCRLPKDAFMLDVGSGTTTLIDRLLEKSYSNLAAADISKIALDKAKSLIDEKFALNVKWIVEDITDPKNIEQFKDVDLWHDRTVLHFLTEESQQVGYLRTLKSAVKPGGFVIIAVFSLEGAKKCSGLNVKNYSYEMIADFLGSEFDPVTHFNHLYIMPSGDERPYVYTLFKRI